MSATRMRGVASALALVLVWRPTLAAADAAAVLECMRANAPRSMRAQTIEITTFDSEDRMSTVRGRVYAMRERDQVNLMVRVDYPRDLANSAYLMRETDTGSQAFLYLPETKRVKRLAASSFDGRLWGTDFSYEEFRQVQGAFAGAAATLDGAAEVEGRAVHVLSITPKGDHTVAAYVDRETCVLLGAEFHSRGKLRKRFSAPAAALQRSGAHWYATEMTMADVARGTRTRLQLAQTAWDQALSRRYFHPQFFHVGN